MHHQNISKAEHMHLQQAINNVFVQISDSLSRLNEDQYSRQVQALSGATIGQHVRHVIELFQCLEQGYSTGTVNYEKRKRDVRIETCKELAAQLLADIYAGLDRPDKALVLEACYDELNESSVQIATNYYREIAYNLEHTVHHMALIRVGIHEVATIELPESFGIASSTIRYRKNVHS